MFSLEFYEYIDRFDRIARGENIRTLETITRQFSVDLFADTGNDRIINSSIPGLVTRSQVAYFANTR